MSTERTRDEKPTAEELSEIKSRVAKTRAVLEDAGLQNSLGATTGTKLVRYFTELSGTSPQEMTVAQWDAAFCTVDGLLKSDPAKAVEIVDEWASPSEEQFKKRQAETEEENKREEARRKERDEKAGPHAQRAKELAAEFLRKLETDGYEGYAIIGIPNHVIESRFEKHLESCEGCQNDDVCDEGCDAMYEDDCFENVFIYETRNAADTGNCAGLAFELGDTDGIYPYTSDLLDAAEPYQPETGGQAAAA
jgi:hypothetical protein